MEQESGRTLRQLLPDSFEHMEDTIKTELSREPGADWGKVPKFAWKYIGKKASDEMDGALDTDVFSIIALAWGKAVELKKYSDPTQFPPDKLCKPYLFEHKLTTKLHPVIEVSVLGFGQTTLVLTLEVTANFRGAQLHIKGGRIIGIAAGECSASAQLKYGEAKLHNEVKLAELKLEKQKPFSPAITIG